MRPLAVNVQLSASTSGHCSQHRLSGVVAPKVLPQHSCTRFPLCRGSCSDRRPLHARGSCRLRSLQVFQEGSLRVPRRCVVRAQSVAAVEAADQGPHRESGGSWVPRLLAYAAGVLLCCSLAAAVTSGTQFSSLSIAARGFSAETIRGAVRSAWAGLAAGCLHTLAGPDHLAALTPLTIGRSHVKASLLGALWGFGHSTGQLFLGLLFVLLKDKFEHLVPALSKLGGITVGLTLIAIGGLGAYECFFQEQEVEEGAESGPILSFAKERKGFGLWTYITGILYGLQPDALFVIIPALTLPSKLAATAYILMFVFGTVAAMGGYTAIIGATSQAIQKQNFWATKRLSGLASVFAICIGMLVLLSGWGIDLPAMISR